MVVRRRRSHLRSITFLTALVVALAWCVGAGLHVMESWPLRNALARVELARAENQCSSRTGSAANQMRCRELVEIMHRADRAEVYLVDGVIVFGPSLLLIGVALWVWRSGSSTGRGGPRRQRGEHHHHRPRAA
jgi:hypothetical protein